MKRILYIVALSYMILTGQSAVGAPADGDLFPYPVPPEGIERLDQRCDYLVSQFWRGCDFKSAMSRKDKLASTFADWISFMPYASADTVHAAIDRLLATVSKSGPQTLEMARMAEVCTYSDTAEIYSEEIYLPFARAAAGHKKIAAADKARFQSHCQIIDNSQVGATVKHLEFVTPEYMAGSIDSIHTQLIVLMFNAHDCDACILSRVRLSADINATELIKQGLLTVLCIEPGEATDEWQTAAARYPDDWVVGASETADEYFTLRRRPEIYLLNSRHKVLAKDVTVDALLSTIANLRQQSGR